MKNSDNTSSKLTTVRQLALKKIPSATTIGKTRYKISVQNSLSPPVYGRVYVEMGLIQIALAYRKIKRSEVAISETFWHEITHAILHDMEHPLWRNEMFVKGFSKRLNQAIRSASFAPHPTVSGKIK